MKQLAVYVRMTANGSFVYFVTNGVNSVTVTVWTKKVLTVTEVVRV